MHLRKRETRRDSQAVAGGDVSTGNLRGKSRDILSLPSKVSRLSSPGVLRPRSLRVHVTCERRKWVARKMTHQVGASDSWQGARSSDSTSTSLLQRVKGRDSDAWRRLVDIYSPLIYRWCRRSGLSAEDANDVGQDVFHALVTNIERFRRERSTDTFRGWLWTVTRNKIRDFFRRRQANVRAMGGTDAQQRLAELPDDPPSVVSDSGHCDDEITVLHRALALIRGRFEDNSWQAFWRTTVEREAGTDVAVDLGMSVQAVYQAKYRVLRRIREELTDLLERA